MLRLSSIVRWLLPLLGGAVILVAGGAVSGLHSRSLAIAANEGRLLGVRHAVTVSDGLTWAIVAQGEPNFTFAQQLSQARGTIVGNLLALEPDRTSVALLHRLELLNGALWGDITHTEAAIAAHHPAIAASEALTGVDGEVELMNAVIAQMQHAYTARADSANANLYDGTLLALGATGGLVALIALLFAAGRRRTLAAERAAIQRSEQRFRALVHRASEVVIVVDREGRVSYVTEASSSILGRSPQELIGQPMETFLPPSEQERARAVFERIVRTSPGDAREWEFERPDGTTTVIEARSENLLDDPNVNGVVVTIRDVSARRQIESQLRHQALHDALTGLANRTLFEDRVRHALQRARRSGRPASVIYIDLDQFKTVNDSLGHAAGDELLGAVAHRVESCLRGSDTAARLGGDEFACLIEDPEDADAPFRIGRRILAALEPPVDIADRPVSARASLGIAFSSEPIDAEQLVRHADLAMYAAKEAGGGQIAAFTADMLAVAHARLQLREDLPGAPHRGEMTLVYQPLVDIAAGDIVGLEALLRWAHPEHGRIGPDRFVPLAEETGAIVAIGQWVVEQSLSDLARLSAQNPQLGMNVNVSPRELREAAYVPWLTAALERHGIEPGRLTVEVTESVDLDEGLGLANLHALSAHGIRIAVDDFGTGLSSLARLQRLPVDQVKMDRSFLAAVDEKVQDEILLRSILELASALELEMVAEGIERDSQLQVIRSAECPLGQGYLFARPAPIEAMAELLRAPAKPAPLPEAVEELTVGGG